MKIKKIIAAALAFAVIGGTAPAVYTNSPYSDFTAYAADDYSEVNLGGIIYNVYGDHAVAAGYDETLSGDITIASEVQGVPVTIIGKEAFKENDLITSVVIPDSVETVKEEAFFKCSELVSATLPDTITEIELYMFAKCGKLEKANIPTSLKKTGNAMFSECRSLSSITIPSNIEMIGFSTFEYCTSLEEVEIPDSVKELDSFAFSRSGLRSVTIPDSVEEIGNYAFSNCDNLETFICPETMLNAGQCILADTPWLQKKREESDLVMLNSLVIDGTQCKGDVTIPDNATCICGLAFSCNKELTSITIPESVTAINYCAFSSVEKLESVTILNPECKIFDRADAFCVHYYGVRGDFFFGTFHGYTDSTLRKYCDRYQRNFIALDSDYTVTATTTVSSTTTTTTTTTSATTQTPPETVTTGDSSTTTAKKTTTSTSTTTAETTTTTESTTAPKDTTTTTTATTKTTKKTTTATSTTTAEKTTTTESTTAPKDTTTTTTEDTTTTTTTTTEDTTTTTTTTTSTSVADIEKSIIGTWEFERFVAAENAETDQFPYSKFTITFRKDGTGKYFTNDTYSEFTWAAKNGSIIMNEGGEYRLVNDNELELVRFNGSAFFDRVTESSVKENMLGTWELYLIIDDESGNAQTITKDEAVFTITFNADGKCSVYYDDKVSGNKETSEYTWAVSEDRSMIEVTDKEGKITEFEISDGVLKSIADETDHSVFYFNKSETTAPEETLGDVNGDGIISAIDASKILVLYASLQTGGTEATDHDFAVCDVNKDGRINSVDASLVLAYYSYLSEFPDATLETFISSLDTPKEK